MKSSTVVGCVIAGWSLVLSANAARAQESPLGLYVGAGAGDATVRQEPDAATGFYGLSRYDTGWDAFIGVRPLTFLGAEIGYTDFGSVRRFSYYFSPVSGTYTNSVLTHESADAPTAFAVGYLPLGLPFVDVYGKAGAARLHKSWDFTEEPISCAPPLPCLGAPTTFSGGESTWDFAWGAGAQWKFGALALRMEYERVSASDGDPDLLSIGVSWTFF